jgi:hypothetical protein
MVRTPAVLLAALSLVAGCASPTEVARPAEPSHLALYIGDIHISTSSSLGMLPGDSLRFAIRLTDAGGHAVSGLHTNLVSRTPSSVSMDSTGMVRVAGRGQSWIVGSVLTPAHNVLADSTLVAVVCTVESHAAVRLTVVDSVSGQSGPMQSLAIVIRDGAARDSAFVPSIAAGAPLFAFSMAFERKGTYTLDVTAAGYQPWERAGIVVTGDICHVTTVAVTAKLQAL